MSRFVLQYQLTFEDYREAIGRVKPVSHGYRHMIPWLIGMAAVGALTALVTVLMPRVPEAKPSQSPGEMVVALLPRVGVFLVIWFFVARTLRGGVRRQWEEQTALHRPKSVEFPDDGIIVFDPAFRLDYHWTAVRECGETPHLFVLYTVDLAFQVLPKRSLGAEAYVEQFRAYVDARLGGRHLFPAAGGSQG